MNNRAGRLVEVHAKQYKAYAPNPIPSLEELIIDSEMLELLSEASNTLGVLDGMAQSIPDMQLFVTAYVRKEALLSSQIEGTQASLVDVLDSAEECVSNMDVNDVVNYIKGLSYAVEKLRDYPLCNRLLKEIHSILLSGTRGNDKNPGEFRHSQNWIGGAHCTLNDARYVPPTPENMIECMSDIEKYINYSEDNVLIKAGLVHYQFETVHPFLDGNGRIGRMLIVLMLVDGNMLSYPILYISYYLKKNRVEYYDRLEAVRNTGNYEQWLKFFLRAIIESTKDTICTIERINDLKRECDIKCDACNGAQRALYEYIWKNPIIDITKTARELGVSYNTVNTGIKKLVEYNILVPRDEQQRNRVFCFEKYIDILKKDTENL